MIKEIIFSKASDKEILEFLSQVKTDENGKICNMEFYVKSADKWIEKIFMSGLLTDLRKTSKYRIKPVQMPEIGSLWVKEGKEGVYPVVEIKDEKIYISHGIMEHPGLVEFEIKEWLTPEQFYHQMKPHGSPQALPEIGSKWVLEQSSIIYEVLNIRDNNYVVLAYSKESSCLRYGFECTLEQFYKKFKPYVEPLKLPEIGSKWIDKEDAGVVLSVTDIYPDAKHDEISVILTDFGDKCICVTYSAFVKCFKPYVEPLKLPEIGSKWERISDGKVFEVTEYYRNYDSVFIDCVKLIAPNAVAIYDIKRFPKLFYGTFKPYVEQEQEFEYVPYTFETFHPHRDRFYKIIDAPENRPENRLRPIHYSEGSIDDMTWEYAFKNLKWENGETFGEKRAVKS